MSDRTVISMNPSISIVDTYYPDFLKSWRFNPALSEETELRQLLNFSFGTGDFYSRNLKALGWEVADYIYNAPLGKPFDKSDVVFMQNLSIAPPVKGELLAGQCSCPMPPEEKIKKYDVIFTSFPHYVERFEKMGVHAVYNPLGFDPIVLDRVGDVGERIYDCVFVGGVGAPSHWKRGIETLEAVARAIPTFKWWGYGYETLPADSALRDKYQGPAWGLNMYRIFLQSKIVLNRHGEVAQGMTNNQRCFEATGCGAVLLTERSFNLYDFFSGTEATGYGSSDEAISAIQSLLKNDDVRQVIGRRGQERTLRDHTYAKRMKTVSDTLMSILCLA